MRCGITRLWVAIEQRSKGWEPAPSKGQRHAGMEWRSGIRRQRRRICEAADRVAAAAFHNTWDWEGRELWASFGNAQSDRTTGEVPGVNLVRRDWDTAFEM